LNKDKIVYIIGVFDLFHRGHVEFLKKCKSFGDKLIVAINGDDMVASYKRRPFFSQDDRKVILESCKYVDEVFVIEGYDNKEYLEKYNVDIIIHGDDWDRDSYLEQIRVDEKYLEDNGIEMLFIPYTKGVSTSELIKKVKENDI
jgi:glycerol-3-phosphate cytidylyltransferase